MWTIPGLVALGIYFQVIRHDYISFDDQYYTYDNPHVAAGLTWDGLKWAFSSGYAANYHPLTWLSLMLDFEIMGNKPGGIALVNALFHATNATLVGLLFLRLFRSESVALFVGVVFAAHPKLVEAVAWISQRKTVLSTALVLVSILLFLRCHESRSASNRRRAYIGSLVFFAGSLLAKGMYVTLPALLPLLWVAQVEPETGRTRWETLRDQSRGALWQAIRPLIRSLMPYAILSVIISGITYVAQDQGHAVHSFAALPLSDRLATSLVGITTYLHHFIYPANLSLLYPREETWSLGTVLGAGSVLLVITGFLSLRRLFPDRTAFFGWVFFLISLLPVVGIVQVGDQASADRYMYGPIIGLLITAVAIFRTASRAKSPQLAAFMRLALCVWVLLLGVACTKQVSRWRDTYSIATASIESVGETPQLMSMQSTALLRAGRYADARPILRRVVALAPNHYVAMQNLAIAEYRLGRLEEAITLMQKRVQMPPADSSPYVNLAMLLAAANRTQEARAAIAKARELGDLTLSKLELIGRIEADLDKEKKDGGHASAPPSEFLN